MRFVLDHSSTIRKCTGVLECYVECSVDKGMVDSTTVQYCIFIHTNKETISPPPHPLSRSFLPPSAGSVGNSQAIAANTSIEQFE